MPCAGGGSAGVSLPGATDHTGRWSCRVVQAVNVGSVVVVVVGRWSNEVMSPVRVRSRLNARALAVWS